MFFNFTFTSSSSSSLLSSSTVSYFTVYRCNFPWNCVWLTQTTVYPRISHDTKYHSILLYFLSFMMIFILNSCNLDNMPGLISALWGLIKFISCILLRSHSSPPPPPPPRQLSKQPEIQSKIRLSHIPWILLTGSIIYFIILTTLSSTNLPDNSYFTVE